jgi:hypothetical protein
MTPPPVRSPAAAGNNASGRGHQWYPFPHRDCLVGAAHYRDADEHRKSQQRHGRYRSATFRMAQSRRRDSTRRALRVLCKSNASRARAEDQEIQLGNRLEWMALTGTHDLGGVRTLHDRIAELLLGQTGRNVLQFAWLLFGPVTAWHAALGFFVHAARRKRIALITGHSLSLFKVVICPANRAACAATNPPSSITARDHTAPRQCVKLANT